MESSFKNGGEGDVDAEGESPASADDVRFPALRAIAELRHPHLTPLRASSDIGFELEPSDGLALDKLIEGPNGEGRLALRIRVRILLDVLSGLAALHRAKVDGKPIGFVHGEVAPHNIRVGRDGLGRLVPLVESHWSSPPVPAEESLGYVAPERLLGDVFDQRADVFSVGVLLWEAIAEKRLFRNMRMDSIVTQLVGNKVSRPPPPPAAPWAEALADVAMQALSVDPADRWPQIGVMGAEIESIAEGALASSEEIARLVRYRLGERLPPPSEEPPVPSTPPRTSSLPPSTSSSVVHGSAARRAGGPSPAAGLVVWRGPQIPRTPPELNRRRDSVRPSVSDLSDPSRSRPSREMVARQSRIVWAAVGLGLALFGVTAFELVERDPPTPSPSANAPKAADSAATAPPAPPPPPLAPVQDTAQRPAAVASARATPAAAGGRPSSKSAPAARTPSSGRASSKSDTSAADAVRAQAKPSIASDPAPAPSPAPPPPVATPAPEPPAPPPPPKPKDDPFGI